MIIPILLICVYASTDVKCDCLLTLFIAPLGRDKRKVCKLYIINDNMC